jgi:phage major head subunit gpT-like protein
MIISSPALDALRVSFKAEFQAGIGATPMMKDRVATTIRSSTGENRYGWMKSLTGMREWLGPRVVDNLSEAQYSIVNRHFEKTVAVDRNDIEDDNLGQYAAAFRLMGETVAAQPELLVWNLLRDGFSTNCWDGQFFFDTDHPIQLENGQTGTYANTDGGSGTRWFLMVTSKAIRPIVYQERKAPEFTWKDRPTDDNVFWEKQFVYGADMRCNVGYGLPQLCWGSRQTLSATTYATARAGIMGMRGDGGRPLGLVPDLLVVPPSLESAGRKLLNSEYAGGGETNEWKGTAELLVVPWLA